jgi:hypothetical protein
VVAGDTLGSRDNNGRDDVTVVDTLNERESKYGDFGELAKAIQAYKSAIRHAPSWVKMTAVQREAAEMIATKLCRVVYGDPLHFDSWHDIAGYATLAAEEFGAGKKPMEAAVSPTTPQALEQTVVGL